MLTQTTVQAQILSEDSRCLDAVRVVDEEGHLLFFYNPFTGCIEIKNSFRGGQKRLYAVSVKMLSSQFGPKPPEKQEETAVSKEIEDITSDRGSEA